MRLVTMKGQKIKLNNLKSNEEIPRLINEINIYPFDVSYSSPKYLIDIGSKKKYEISETLYNIIILIDGVRDVNKIAEDFTLKTGKKCSKDDVKIIIDNYLIPNGLAYDNNTNLKPPKRSYLYIKIPLLHRNKIQPITRIFKLLFKKPVFRIFLALIFVVHIFVYLLIDIPRLSFELLSGFELLYIYIVLFISVFFHELGHASACTKYNCNHGPIGIGLYLYFIVFYVDVSDAWRLNRKQRAMIDFGGMYFQLIFTLFLFILFLIFKLNIYIYTINILDLMIVMAFNPLLRWDGYWLFSDLTGVPNLRERANGILKYLISKTFNRQTVHPSLIQEINNREKIFVYFYAIISNLYFLFFGYKLVELAPWHVLNYPVTISNNFSAIRWDILNKNYIHLIDSIIKIIFSTIIILMLVMVIYRLFLFLSAKYKSLKN